MKPGPSHTSALWVLHSEEGNHTGYSPHAARWELPKVTLRVWFAEGWATKYHSWSYALHHFSDQMAMNWDIPWISPIFGQIHLESVVLICSWTTAMLRRKPVLSGSWLHVWFFDKRNQEELVSCLSFAWYLMTCLFLEQLLNQKKRPWIMGE